MSRNQIIAGICILAAFAVLILTDYNDLTHRLTNSPAEIARKWQTVQLGYCDSNNVRPCVVSFSRTDGGMLVNLLLPSGYPDFYLAIEKGDQTIHFECATIKALPTSATCEGAELLPGETLHFTLASMQEHYALAEGRFAIIGLLLATPEMEPTITPTLTETPEPTETSIFSPTALLLEILTPLPVTPTATQSSYPNP